MAPLHVGLEAAEVVPHLLHGQPSAVYQRFQLAQLPALPVDLLPVDLAHHLAGVGQDGAPVQECHALRQRVHGGFVVQFQAQPVKVFPDDAQAFPQIFPVRVYQDEVIHIADIMPDAQPFFDQVVQVIQHRQGNKLAHFAAQADAAPAAAKTVYDVKDAPGGFPVLHALGNGCLGHVVRDAVKEVADVAAQHPAIRREGKGRVPGSCPLFPVVSFQVAGQPVQGIVHAAPAQAGAVVRDKMPGDGVI